MAAQTDTQVREVIRQALDAAARRQRTVVLASEAPLALTLMLGGLLLLELAGTALLHPLWTVAIACCAIAIAAVRFRRKSLPVYEVAQAVDARLRLQDALSTACFLSRGTAPVSPLVAFQLASAAQLAAKISPRQAFPFERSRTWCLVVLLLIAVAGSMLLRYARLGGLDLRAPVIHFALPQQSVAAAREIVKNLLKKPQQPIPSPLQPTLAEPDVDSSGRGAGSKDPSEAIRNLERQFEAGQKSGASENLLDRLGDTLRGLGSEVKQSLARNQRAANREGSGREQAQKNDGSDAASQSSSKPSSSDPAASQNQDQSGEQQSAKAEARAIEKQNGSPLGPADQAAQQKGSDAQSGAGRDEGQKTIQNAEQLKAIGKLEQIIGKRSAAITGEMRLAKSSHDQQLQTQYSNRVGEHSDRGGEIHHDQVPPEYRDYIRAYMDAEHAANHDH